MQLTKSNQIRPMVKSTEISQIITIVYAQYFFIGINIPKVDPSSITIPNREQRTQPKLNFAQKNGTRNSSLPPFIAPIRPSDDASFAEPRAGGNIFYKIGNPVLTGATKVHIAVSDKKILLFMITLIAAIFYLSFKYYGSWTASEINIVSNFVSCIGSTSWFNIEKSYYYQATASSNKIYTTGPVTLGNQLLDEYSLGSYIFGNDIQNLLTAYIDLGYFPKDRTAIYLFLVSADVFESIRDDLGPAYFCYDYCGYHISFTIGKQRLFFAFAGNVAGCITGCATNNVRVSPNGNPGIDAMLSTIAHEIVEVMSDPVSDISRKRAWEDADGYENADKW